MVFLLLCSPWQPRLFLSFFKWQRMFPDPLSPVLFLLYGLLVLWRHQVWLAVMRPILWPAGVSLWLVGGFPMCWQSLPPKGCSMEFVSTSQSHGQQLLYALSLVVSMACLQDGFINSATSSHHTNHNFVGRVDLHRAKGSFTPLILVLGM